MKTLCTLTKSISAPPERVFAALSDFENAPSRIPAILKIEMLTTGPVGVGTKFKETRKMFGKETTETMEVTAYDAPRRIEVGGDSCGVIFRSNFTVTPEAAGSRVDLTVQTESRTTFAKVMGVLMGWMMKGTMKKCMVADLEHLAKHLEQE